MSAVAKAAGVARALVYHYFPGKEDLLRAVLESEADQLLADTDIDPSLSPRDNAEAALRAHGVEPVGPGGDDAVDFVLVLGGDGTILRACEIAREHDVPLVGVNTGHVGFPSLFTFATKDPSTL